MKRFIYTLLSVFFLFGYESFAQTQHEKIKNRMHLLETMLGKWEVESEFTSRSGKVRREKGIYEFSWALDSTYFKWSGKLTNIENERKRTFVCWITWDEKKDAYVQTYLFSKSARQTTVYGQFDSTSLTYITHTTFQLSDGVTEILRNEISLKNPDQLNFAAWAKFDDALEVNNHNSVLNRIKME